MTPKIFEYNLLIKEAHLDTFGHVNNAKYLELLEEARWDLITQNSYGLKEVMAKKIGPVILEVNLKFRKELKLREKIKVLTSCKKHEGKIGTIEQKIINEKGEESAIAVFTYALFDLAQRKIIDPTPEWLKAIGY
ncbi:MAG: acyl-CoA thioesterase [Bdellovibrionota bacterium]